MHPLFSIITVTYNAETTLPATMASVAAQNFNDFEHIIVDGASSDSTLDIAREKALPCTRIVSERDNGIYDAMNKGIGLATGKYYIFLNAGDSFHTPETLNDIARIIQQNDSPDIVYGQTQLVDARRNRVADRHLTAPECLTYDSFAQGMVVCHQAFVVFSGIAPLYNLNYRFSADYDWCVQCLKRSQRNVYLPGIMIDYLQDGVTTANHRASLIERFKIMCHYYGTTMTILRHFKFLLRHIAYKRKLK